MTFDYEHLAEVFATASDEEQYLLLDNSLTSFLIADSLITRSTWVDEFLTFRNSKGEFVMLYNELMQDETKCFKYFRMRPTSFFYLLEKIRHKIAKEDTNWRKCISPEERLMVTLRFLSTGMSYSALFFCFRISVSAISKLVDETCVAIWDELQPVHLPEPTLAIVKQSAQGFEEDWNVPNCFGSIDGKHISLKKPSNSYGLFYNYKGYHSVVLQGVADSVGRFLTIDVGAHGRQSDGGTLRQTPIFQALTSGQFPLPPDRQLPRSTLVAPYFLIGDEAYPLRSFLMRPFQKSVLTQERTVFNQRLSRARQTIECAFGTLAAKWRVMKTEIELSADKVDKITKACCVLHNLVIDLEGLQVSPSTFAQVDAVKKTPGRNFNHSPHEATKKRDELVAYFNSKAGRLPKSSI